MTAQFSPAAATPDDSVLTVGAAAVWRRRSAVLLSVGSLATVVAVLLALSEGSAAGSPANLLAALGMLAAGASGLMLTLERRTRELARRTTPLLVLGLGVALIYLALALGFLWGYTGRNLFADALELPAALLGLPLWIVATVALTWPPRMAGRDLLLVVIDGLVGGLTLLATWILLLAPQVAGEGPRAQIDRLLLWGAFVVVLIVLITASANRRSGALPIEQLVLLQSSALIFVVGSVAGDLTHSPDGAHALGLPVLAYSLAPWLFRAAMIGPAVTEESWGRVRLRSLWSRGVPFLPVPISAAAVVVNRLAYAPLPQALLIVVLAILVTVVAGNVALRLMLDRDLGRMKEARMAPPLTGGEQTRWFEALLGDSREVVTVVDGGGTVLYQTPSAAALIGRAPGALLGKHISDIFPDVSRRRLREMLARAAHDEADRGPHEMVLVDVGGRRHDTETVISPLPGFDFDCYVLTTNDVSDRRRLRAALADTSLRDQLTGLPNREGFLLRVREEVPAAAPGMVAVALVDLDDFRALNDSRGHGVGDQVLQVVASALERMPVAVAAVGRTGPDEFALLVVADLVGPELAVVHAGLRDALTRIVIDQGSSVTMDFALGYSVKMDRATAAAELLEHADLALAAARSGRSPTPVAYRPEMRSELVSRLRTEADLRDALDSDRLFVVYQPIVSLADGAITSVEALARLRTPTGEVVGPAGFVPVAESLGLIGRLGLQIMTAALSDSVRISEAAGREIGVSVNVSASQLDDRLPASVQDSLGSTAVAAHRLTLEITESVLAERHDEARAVLERLRVAGCRVALDDFGTGYSSLSYLAGLTVDLLKIDRSFVAGLGSSEESFTLVRTIRQLASSLGLVTVAEGVETVEQADILRGMGCEYAQGYLFGRPMPLADLLERVRPLDPMKARGTEVRRSP